MHIFERNQKKINVQQLSVKALQHLQRLQLYLGELIGHGATCDRYPDVSGLPSLLRCMTGLVELGLKFPSHCGNPVKLYYDQVFPKEMCWNKLESLILRAVAIGGKSLRFLSPVLGLQIFSERIKGIVLAVAGFGLIFANTPIL